MERKSLKAPISYISPINKNKKKVSISNLKSSYSPTRSTYNKS